MRDPPQAISHTLKQTKTKVTQKISKIKAHKTSQLSQSRSIYNEKDQQPIGKFETKRKTIYNLLEMGQERITIITRPFAPHEATVHNRS